MKTFTKLSVLCMLLIFCLAIAVCAYRQGTRTTKIASEVIAVETFSDLMSANIALGNNWCYFRFNISREELLVTANDLRDDVKGTNRSISLALPGNTPEDSPFYINITYDDIEKSLQLLDEHPEQTSVNWVKELSTDALKDLENS